MSATRRVRTITISPEILDRAPHLGALVIVDHSLRVAVYSLYADIPALMGDPHPWHPEPRDVVAARRLVKQIGRFARALERYRHILAPLLEPPSLPSDDDAGF